MYTLTSAASDRETGLLTRIVEPDGLVKSFTYYPNRAFFQYTLPNGGTGTYYYDSSGRKARFVNERGFSTVYEVDAKGMVSALHLATLRGSNTMPMEQVLRRPMSFAT